jgi:hypothetical protein
MVVLRCERLPELGHGAGVEKMCRGADSGGTGDDHARSRARAARARRRRNNALRAVIVMGGGYRRQAGLRQARAHAAGQSRLGHPIPSRGTMRGEAVEVQIVGFQGTGISR